MTLISLPNQNVSGPNLWSQVEDNDEAIADVVNGGLDDTNIASGANISGAKLANASVTSAKLSLTVASDTTATQTSIPANSEANVTGLSLSLAAGTYLLLATVQTSNSSVDAVLYNQTDSAEIGIRAINGGDDTPYTLIAIATLAATKTVGIRGINTSGDARNFAANSTQIHAIRIG